MASFNRTGLCHNISFGSRQKSMRKYIKARGRHNKIRQKEKSRPVKVEIGFKNAKITSGLINGKIPVLVYNLDDLNKAGKDNIVIIGKIGDKSKLEIVKKILEKKIEVQNLNINKFMKAMGRKEKLKEIKKSKENGKKEDKKADNKKKEEVKTPELKKTEEMKK